MTPVPLQGACHCGNLQVELEATRTPPELPVRLCGCTFCRRAQPRYTSDPQGRVTVRVQDAAQLSRYRFGMGLADFLVCRRCGSYVAAFEPGASETDGRAVVNLNVLDAAAGFSAAPATMDYDAEDEAARRARRARAWTPARILVASKTR